MDPVTVNIVMAIVGWIVSPIITRYLNKALDKWAKTVKLGKEVSALKEEFRKIACLLYEVKRSNVDNPHLIEYVRDLHQSMYDAEDLLDELEYYRLQDDFQTPVIVPGNSNIFFGIKKISCRSVSSVLVKTHGPSIRKLDRSDMSKRINCVIKKLKENGEEVRKAVKLEKIVGFTFENLRRIVEEFRGASINQYNTTKFPNGYEVVGRDEEKIRTWHLLKAGNLGDESISVLPIVGHGGIGKSTFVKFIYEDAEVKTYFHVRLWLELSPTLDVEKLTLNMVRNLVSNSEYESVKDKSLEVLQSILESQFEINKVLLVVDNLWPDMDVKLWNQLIKPFQGTSKNGSRILVTTRYPSVAKRIGTMPMVVLGGLKGKARGNLFNACAFGDKNPENYQSLRIVRQCIVNKLNGYPLEIKTIGAILRDNLDLTHWKAIEQSDEWKIPKGANKCNHIMSSLKISYQYLSHDFQKCFSYCSLFPKNFKFKKDDLINLWIAEGFIYSKSGLESKQLGSNCLDELVGRGFFEEIQEYTKYETGTTTYYLMHELVHDLAKNVSFDEFLTIDGSEVEIEITGNAIRHVSIIMYFAYNWDSSTKRFIPREKFRNKLEKITKELEISKLRTLIVIGNYDSNFSRNIQNLCQNAKCLRVLRLSMEPVGIDSLLCDISNSLHLRYLKLESCYLHSPSNKKENKNNNNNQPAKTVFGLYHLETLDIRDWYDDFNFPRLTRLIVNLHRFHARGNQLAVISDIGKLVKIQELGEFMVKKDPGFDIGQLRELTDLGGSFSISNIENIDSRAAADKAKLNGKEKLQGLSFYWSSNRSDTQPDLDANILEGLEPPHNIGNLNIHGYVGTKFPSWMVHKKYLTCLHLINCSNLEVLPPLGQLLVLEKLKLERMPRLKKISNEFYGSYEEKAFHSLREMVFTNMENCEEWAGYDGRPMFPSLNKLEILDSKKLCKLPLQFYSRSVGNTDCFPKLTELVIQGCPKLILPPLPHVRTLKAISFIDGTDPLKNMSLLSNSPKELSLSIAWETERRTINQEVLVFPNLKALTGLTIIGCPVDLLPWKGFQELVLLKTLVIKDLWECSSKVTRTNTQTSESFILPKTLELLEISSNSVTGKHLSEWLLQLPCLLSLVVELPKISCLVVEKGFISSAVNSPSGEGLLQIFPNSVKYLQELRINGCGNLVFLNVTQEGLRGFNSLKKLTIKGCSRLLSSLVNEELDENSLLPPSLLQLEIDKVPDKLQTRLLSNLAHLHCLKLVHSPNLKSLSMHSFVALKELNIEYCMGIFFLEGVSILSSLRKLKILKCPGLAAAWDSALRKEKRNFSLALEVLIVDDMSFLTKKICKCFGSLEKLVFNNVQTKEITREQGESLGLLTSLQQISFESCSNLQSLANEMQWLHSLSTLKIIDCPQLKSLPDGFPYLTDLYLVRCSSQLVRACKVLNEVKNLHIS